MKQIQKENNQFYHFLNEFTLLQCSVTTVTEQKVNKIEATKFKYSLEARQLRMGCVFTPFGACQVNLYISLLLLVLFYIYIMLYRENIGEPQNLDSNDMNHKRNRG